MTDGSLSSVNEHCLDNVMKLAETSAVTAAEDIYDANGVKLWAKGAEISPAIKERLVRRKLRKPLESSLSVADTVTTKTVLMEARTLLEEVPALKVFLGTKRASVFDALSQMSLHPTAALLLTVAEKSREGAFRHGVLVGLMAASLGAHQTLSHKDSILLALAGLLHDIGELYIRPDYLHPGRALKPAEWKHIAVHPRIGQIVLDELTDYPKLVVDAVAGHHERVDGSGYPRRLTGAQISAGAQIVAIAEMLSGILVTKDDALVRSCLALKCIPGEHPKELISLVAMLKRNHADELFAGSNTEVPAFSATLEVAKIMRQALDECAKIAREPALPPSSSELLQRAQGRLGALRQALEATGIGECLEKGHAANLSKEDREVLLEIDVVGQEIGWRLRDIARDLYLRTEEAGPEFAATFSELIGTLDRSLPT